MPTKRPKTKPPRAQATISIEELLVLSVSALVSKFADAMTEDQGEALKMEAHLYRTLEVNCAQKAKLATTFAAEEPKFAAVKEARR